MAVGETLRRLTGKALAKTAVAGFKTHFEPIQLGVGTSGGCEATVHTARQWLARNRDSKSKVLVTLDLENAFNCVDRSAFLREARRMAPNLVPWLDYCYKTDGNLLLGQHRLRSARGIQQGDPLGPALFALSVHELSLIHI